MSAIIVNTAVTEALFAIGFVGVLIATIPDVRWGPVLVIAAVTNLVVPILFYARSKTLWVAIDLFFNPAPGEETSTPMPAEAHPPNRA